MNIDAERTDIGPAEQFLAKRYSNTPGYLMVTARVMLVGFGPGQGNYVGVDFVPPPDGGPLGVSTTWDARGVELAEFAMAHGKRLQIVYRSSGFAWRDILELAVVDF